jgi:hypothetical protein
VLPHAPATQRSSCVRARAVRGSTPVHAHFRSIHFVLHFRHQVRRSRLRIHVYFPKRILRFQLRAYIRFPCRINSFLRGSGHGQLHDHLTDLLLAFLLCSTLFPSSLRGKPAVTCPHQHTTHRARLFPERVCRATCPPNRTSLSSRWICVLPHAPATQRSSCARARAVRGSTPLVCSCSIPLVPLRLAFSPPQPPNPPGVHPLLRAPREAHPLPACPASRDKSVTRATTSHPTAASPPQALR